MNTKRTSSLEKYTHILGCQKSGAFTYESRKIGSVMYFVEKKKAANHIYLAALKKEAIWHAHPYYAIYRKLPAPPPPPRAESISNTWQLLKRNTCGDWQQTIMHCVNTVSAADCRCYFKHVGYLIIRWPMC